MAIRGKGRGFGVAAVVGVGVVVLVGCDGSEAPLTPTPTVTAPVMPSATASPSPEVTASASPSAEELTDEELLALMPAGADFPDVQGAIITAEFFLEQYGPMVQTGDTTVWDALSAEGCGYCEIHHDSAKQIADTGRTATGGDLEPTRSEGRLDELDEAYIKVTALQHEGELRSPDGVIETTLDEVTDDFYFHLRLEGALWRVVTVEVPSGGE